MTKPAAVPAPPRRSPAQVEASRRNGAHSRGPVTTGGKARASRNALKHGLDALHHLVLEDEAPEELEQLTARLLDEVGARSELEARLARRLAIAFWKGERAERMEVALLDAAPRLRPPTRGGTWEQADPLTTFDVRRFNAVRGHQAAQGREISRCLKELRQLRKNALVGDTREPDATSRNEPEGWSRSEPDHAGASSAWGAPNSDKASHGTVQERARNEPDDGAPPRLPGESEPLQALRQAIRAEIAAQAEAEEPKPERLTALLRQLWLERVGLRHDPANDAGSPADARSVA